MTTLLKMLFAVARVSAARQAATHLLARLVLAFTLIVAALGLLVAGCGFGLYALYLLLTAYMAPAPSAGIIAAALAVVAMVLTAIAVFGLRRRTGRRGAAARGEATSSETLESLTRLLGDWVKANPGQAAATAFVIGFLAGARR